jgi:hypothetical protein
MTIFKRLPYADIYTRGDYKRTMVIGGDVSNVLPFDDDGAGYVPEHYKLSEAENISPGVWKLKTGRYGYIADLNNSIIRIYPVRRNWKKYVEIHRLIPQQMEYRQINDKVLELYVNTPTFQWSFLITDRGFKTLIKLKNGYNDGNVLKMGFKLNGLTRQGAHIMDGEKEVLHLKKPFLYDSSTTPIVRDVDESISDDRAELSFDLSGLSYPVFVDPTLGPINPSMDTFMSENSPTAGFGQLNTINIKGDSGLVNRILIQFDGSAIPVGSSVTSATMSLFAYFVQAAALGKQVDCYRLTVYDWEDAGTGTANAEANWNNYKDPNVAWPGGAGAGSDTDATDLVSANVPAVGNFIDFTPTDMMQDAVDNRSGLLNVFLRYNTEGAGSTESAYRSLEHGTAAQRPKLTVEYEEPVGGFMEGGFAASGIIMDD